MNKKDCKVGMIVAVTKNLNSLARSRVKIKRIGKIVGIYDDFVNLVLFDCVLPDTDYDFENITLGRQMYNETFRFYEISNLKELDEK